MRICAPEARKAGSCSPRRQCICATATRHEPIVVRKHVQANGCHVLLALSRKYAALMRVKVWEEAKFTCLARKVWWNRGSRTVAERQANQIRRREEIAGRTRRLLCCGNRSELLDWESKSASLSLSDTKTGEIGQDGLMNGGYGKTMS
jgi:hypothetical protein